MASRQIESINSRELDWVVIFIYLGLVATGWFMIYAVDYSPTTSAILDMKTRHGIQLVWIAAALLLAVFTLVIDHKFYRVFAYVIYGASIVLLLAVLLFAREVNGARAWLDIGGFKLQPGEFAKTAVTLALAAYLGAPQISLAQLRTKIVALVIIFFPAAIILLQQDTGSALVFFSFFLLLYREGFSPILYIIVIIVAILSVLTLMYNPLPLVVMVLLGAAAILSQNLRSVSNLFTWGTVGVGIACVALLYFQRTEAAVITAGAYLGILSLFQLTKRKWEAAVIVAPLAAMLSFYVYSVNYVFNNVLQPHQQERIWVWLRPEKCDPRGSLYNVLQSKMAIGSGGLTGRGYLQGTLTKLNYVPEQATDFIFCTIGEEQGFLGVFMIIGLYLALLLRIVNIAERQRTKFNRLYAYGVLGILFFHLMINVGMTMGLFPVIGIPLPFISYGGSSLFSFSILLGILVKLDSSRIISN